MTNPPPITVLLAVFNGQQYLREAVESVLSQTFGEFEFLIIDDGSTDNSLAILREYARRDGRIRLITRPNKGLTNTLNEGLSLATGEFLARMDADDICMPRRFERQISYLKEHPDCVLVGSRVLLMDPEAMPIREMCMEQSHDEIDAAHLNRGWPVVHPAAMMRLSALKQIGGYRDEFNTLEDLDLFLRLAEVGQLANLPDVLLHYRQHFASVTHSREQKQMEIPPGDLRSNPRAARPAARRTPRTRPAKTQRKTRTTPLLGVGRAEGRTQTHRVETCIKNRSASTIQNRFVATVGVCGARQMKPKEPRTERYPAQ